MPTITIHDQTTTGHSTHSLTLDILSKALLLANDHEITDPAILSQITRT